MPHLPYGSWPSPIGADAVARHDGAPGWPAAVGEEVWWTEPRPEEGGRTALCRTRLDRPEDGVEEVLGAPWNARTRVHEYGGRPYLLLDRAEAGTAVVFSEYTDQRLYLFFPGQVQPPSPLTPEPEVPGALRYAEAGEGPPGRDEVWCIREEHTGPAPTDVRRALVAVPMDGSAAEDPSAVRVVAEGRRFLACPRVSPDGLRLSWIGWDHPDMPWDSTFLTVAAIGPDGTADGQRDVAGGPGESVVQAEWGDPATLYCVSDASGWWNPYQISIGRDGGAARAPVALAPAQEEYGGPLWTLGQRWILPLNNGLIAAVHGTGSTRLSLLCPDSGALTDVATPHTEWSGRLALAGAAGGTIVGVAASPDLSAQVVAVVAADRSWRSLSRRAGDEPEVQHGYAPRAERRVFTGPGGREVHAIVHPPHNPRADGPEGEPPPYAVWAHGGPTGRSTTTQDAEVAYFTSRGIGVVQVDYGGSTGYGRAYRERLRGQWGVVDVEDCAAVARALAAEGTADPDRLAIRGGSAGGWTAAAALATENVFACGVIQYPIVDLAGWRTGETHDFESQYLESLVGPWPQERERYEERSPVNRADAITAPFVLMQGDEDEICPPVQARRLLERVKGRGVPHSYMEFAGEQHGFRKAESIQAALEAELSLYAQVFGFDTDAPALDLRT